jgi:hypothetical protein
VQELDDGYRVLVCVDDVSHADVLTTALARSIGGLLLREAGVEGDAADEEIAAVASGFGVLLANGAAVWTKSCGGLRAFRASVLSVEELTVALALFAAVHRTKASVVRAHLGATQREALDCAEEWVESNPLLVESLRDRPALLEAGLFDVEPARGLVGRWLHNRKVRALEEERGQASTSAGKAPMSEERRRRLEEARRLVDEAFSE